MLVMPPTAFTPARPRPLTDIEFCAWIGQAMPGDRLEYHRGFLGIDTTAVISTLPEPDRRRLAALAAPRTGPSRRASSTSFRCGSAPTASPISPPPGPGRAARRCRSPASSKTQRPPDGRSVSLRWSSRHAAPRQCTPFRRPRRARPRRHRGAAARDAAGFADHGARRDRPREAAAGPARGRHRATLRGRRCGGTGRSGQDQRHRSCRGRGRRDRRRPAEEGLLGSGPPRRDGRAHPRRRRRPDRVSRDRLPRVRAALRRLAAAMREGFADARSETTGKPVFRLEARDR